MNKEQYKTYLRQRLNEGRRKEGLGLRAVAGIMGHNLKTVGDYELDAHPHGRLIRRVAWSLGLHPFDIFNKTDVLPKLTKDSSQEEVDEGIKDVLAEHGHKLWRKLSKDPTDPYYTPPARYGSSPERDFDAFDEHDTEANNQYDRFVDDFTDHVNNNARKGSHTEFKGTPRYDGVDEIL